MDETLSVELSADTWILLFFLVKRGLIHELENAVYHTPGCGCLQQFTAAKDELSKRLPAEVTSPRPRHLKTLPPHPTSH